MEVPAPAPTPALGAVEMGVGRGGRGGGGSIGKKNGGFFMCFNGGFDFGKEERRRNELGLMKLGCFYTYYFLFLTWK